MSGLVIAFLLMIGPLLFRFPARTVNYSPSVSFLWRTDFENSTELPQSFQKQQLKPFNAVVNPDAHGFAIQFPGRKKTIGGDDLAYAGIYASGYFLYQKTGKDIAFYSNNDELLWKKNFPSYPVTEPYGNLVLLMTGDADRVDFVDASGNPTGDFHVSGNLLSDYEFASRSHAIALLFGGGGLYVIDDKGKIQQRFSADSEHYFYKSCALSPSGNTAAIHVLADKTDMILLVRFKDGKAKVVSDFKLDKVYPFTIALAVSDSLATIVAAPESTSFFVGDEKIWSVPYKSGGVRYAISDNGFLASVNDSRISFYLESGAEVASLPFPQAEGPRKLDAGILPGTLMLRSFKDISYYEFHGL